MNKVIEKFFSSKRNIVVLIIIMIVIIGTASYTAHGLKKNIRKMAEPYKTPLNYAIYPIPHTANKNAKLINQGAYLVKAGNCIACHTHSAENGKPFAGGLPIQTPFGVIYSPNITPDKTTGIGNWTNEQFIQAMHKGISPTGSHYYPAFPYLYFSKVTTEDLLAIKAYLENIPAITQKNRKNKMVWPFNWRFLQFGWRLLFFNPTTTGPYTINPEKSAIWNRGAYLVEGLGHCAMCHTPSYNLFTEKLPLGAPISKYNLMGAKVQGFLAPNITKTRMDHFSNTEIKQVFKNDRATHGGNIEGPMLEANHDGLAYLTEADILAIATYLKSVESKTPKKSLNDPGKTIYENYCAGCHTTGLHGAPKYGDTLRWNTAIKKGQAKLYLNTIHGIGAMPAKGTCLACNDEDIQQAVDYILLSIKDKTSQKTKHVTIRESKRIYAENCSVCHDTHFKGAQKPGDTAAWEPIIANGFLNTYLNVVTGRKGHPPQGACPHCTDDDLLAVVKYMMQQKTNF